MEVYHLLSPYQSDFEGNQFQGNVLGYGTNDVRSPGQEQPTRCGTLRKPGHMLLVSTHSSVHRNHRIRGVEENAGIKIVKILIGQKYILAIHSIILTLGLDNCAR